MVDFVEVKIEERENGKVYIHGFPVPDEKVPDCIRKEILEKEKKASEQIRLNKEKKKASG